MSKTRAIASSPATRTRRKICAPAAAVVLPAVSFNDSEIPLTSSGASGASPKSTPVSKLVARVKSSTRQSMAISSARGMPPALVSWTRRTPAKESATPRTAPHNASKMPSVTNCRARRTKLAPSAPRIAISRRRASARASRRFATFTLAMSNTKTTAPSSINRAGRTLATTSACRGKLTMV